MLYQVKGKKKEKILSLENLSVQKGSSVFYGLGQ